MTLKQNRGNTVYLCKRITMQQDLPEKFGPLCKFLVRAPYFFPKNVGEPGGNKKFFPTFKKNGSKFFSRKRPVQLN
jgi:hypothetical protein